MGIEYQGCNYRGWQRQNHTHGASGEKLYTKTVQSELEIVLSEIADHSIIVECAGRTDSGVHATAQVISFSTSAIRSIEQWRLGANALLPNDISVTWVCQVDDDFHARFSAKSRHYQYIISENPGKSNAIFAPFIVHPKANISYPLDVELMNQAAQCLLGTHDFTTFRASGCQAKTASRTVHAVRVCRYQQFIVIEIIANAFLYNMVRNIVGALVDIGAKKRSVSWMSTILAQKSRLVGYKTMPPNGLYLAGVGYPNHKIINKCSHFRKIMLISGHLPLQSFSVIKQTLE